jgi:hypothetical protein
VGQVGKIGRVGGVGLVNDGRVGQVGRLGLSTVVLVHLAISIVHGQAHTGAHVALSPAAAAFVYIVILAGPLVGLALLRWRAAAGAWTIAASLGGALLFGLVNHFIISGADRVDHVPAEWRTLFGVTAALLLVTEAAGTALGVWSALRIVRRTA